MYIISSNRSIDRTKHQHKNNSQVKTTTKTSHRTHTHLILSNLYERSQIFIYFLQFFFFCSFCFVSVLFSKFFFISSQIFLFFFFSLFFFSLIKRTTYKKKDFIDNDYCYYYYNIRSRLK